MFAARRQAIAKETRFGTVGNELPVEEIFGLPSMASPAFKSDRNRESQSLPAAVRQALKSIGRCGKGVSRLGHLIKERIDKAVARESQMEVRCATSGLSSR